MRIRKRILGSLTCLFFINGMWMPSNFQSISPATSQGWRDRSPANGVARMDMTFSEVYGLTEDWVKEFFERPDSYIQEYFGIPACGDNPNCVDIANHVLRSKRNSWSGSKDKGRILV